MIIFVREEAPACASRSADKGDEEMSDKPQGRLGKWWAGRKAKRAEKREAKRIKREQQLAAEKALEAAERGKETERIMRKRRSIGQLIREAMRKKRKSSKRKTGCNDGRHRFPLRQAIKRCGNTGVSPLKPVGHRVGRTRLKRYGLSGKDIKRAQRLVVEGKTVAEAVRESLLPF